MEKGVIQKWLRFVMIAIRVVCVNYVARVPVCVALLNDTLRNI